VRKDFKLEVAARLIEEGIPKDRIVLGFQAPYKRTLEGFASGQRGKVEVISQI
jgi:XisI protein